jgi:hypothetical protein
MTILRAFPASRGQITTGLAVLAVGLTAHAATFTQTAALHRVQAFAAGQFADGDSSTALGSVFLERADADPLYTVAARVDTAIDEAAGTIRFAGTSLALTPGPSNVPCTFDADSRVDLTLPADSFLSFDALRWAASADAPLGDAEWTVRVERADGTLLALESAPANPLTATLGGLNLPAGSYRIASISEGVTVPGSANVAAQTRGELTVSLTAGFRGCSDADTNYDDVVDFGDASLYLDYFSRQDPRADLDDDGVIGFGDVGRFVTAFAAGCP